MHVKWVIPSVTLFRAPFTQPRPSLFCAQSCTCLSKQHEVLNQGVYVHVYMYVHVCTCTCETYSSGVWLVAWCDCVSWGEGGGSGNGGRGITTTTIFRDASVTTRARPVLYIMSDVNTQFLAS